MPFAWDPKKAVSNPRDHKVTFEEVPSVAGDSLAIIFGDPDHSEGESSRLLEGDESCSSPTSEAVNEALGGLVRVARKSVRPTRSSGPRKFVGRKRSQEMVRACGQRVVSGRST
jgi:hypothetical protein